MPLIQVCARSALLVATFLLVCTTLASAQRVRGVVVDSASGQPIVAAIATVLDSSRRDVGRVMTDSRGTFDAPRAPVAARLRVVRLGFRPTEVDLARTGAPLVVRMSALSMLLEPVRVEDESSCPRRSDHIAAFALWEQAKAGLLATVVARQSLPATMTNLTYKRQFEGNSDRVAAQQVRIHRGNARSSFRAVQSAVEFARQGFVKATDEGDLYFGPDADILLDPDFMRHYCLSMAAPDRARPQEAGVSFAPAERRRDRVDINGTIWIDTTRRTLQRISFRYLGLDPATDRFRPGGELVFQQVREGVPQIQRWSFRTVVDRDAAAEHGTGRALPPVGPRRYVVHGEGGELARASWSDGVTWAAPLGTARIHAMTKDGAPVPGLLLVLEATDYRATTDSIGIGELTMLLPGPYRVAATDSALAAIGISAATSMEFTAERDSVVDVSLVVPSPTELVEKSCRKDGLWTPGSYALVVRVVNPDGTPVSGARWQLSVGRSTGVTGSDGVFQYCFGLDLGTIVQIRVSRDGEMPTTVTRTLSRKLTTVRLELPPKAK